MPEPGDQAFLKQALAHRFLTPVQADRLLKAQAAFEARGDAPPIAETAVKLRMMTPPQASSCVPRVASGGRKKTAVRRAEAKGDPKNKKLLVLGLAGGGGLLIVVLLAAVVMSGHTSRTRAPEPESEPPVAVKPAGASKLHEPTVKEVEEEMRRAAEAQRKKFIEGAEERKREAEKSAAERRAAEEKEKARIAAEEGKAADERKTREAEGERGYQRRVRERRAESAKALDEARKGIEEDRRAETARQKALAEKLKTQKLSIKLRNGMALDNVVVQAMTRDELKLAFTFEGAVAEQSFPVEFIHDASYGTLLKAVYKGDGAAGAYERGRHLVLRKLWKEAQAAFEECVKLDASFQPRVPDLSRILNNEAAFKGTARRVGADQLLLSYDFSDAAMAQDFTAVQPQPAKIEVEGGELKISSPATALWSLKDVDFDRELEVDALVVLDDTASLLLGAFFNWERKGYLAVLNNKTPAGHFLFRNDTAKRDTLAHQSEPKVAGGTELRLRFTARQGALRLYVGDQEAAAANDAAFTKGWFYLGVTGGTARVKKLTVQGKVNPEEINKRFAEVEVLIRRAFEADLGKKRAEEDASAPLSAEDDYFMDALDSSFKADYEKARRVVTEAIKKQRFQLPLLALFDPLIKKNPKFAPCYFWRGLVYHAAQRMEEAKKDFSEAMRLCPDFFEAQHQEAQLLLDDRELEGAAESVKKALALAPGNGESVALAGFLRFVRGDAKGATADLEVARKLDPASDEVIQRQRNVVNVLKGPQHLGAKHVKEFPHYVVMTDISPEKTLLYGNRLEAAYKHYAETFKDFFAEDPKRPKPRVAVFNTREAYMTYGELTLSHRQEWTLGYFHPLYKELLLFEDVDQEATLQTLYHEAFHQFMSLMIDRIPPYWYNEGMAEYMGGLRIEVLKGQSKIAERAKILGGRLKGLKPALGMAMPFEQIMMQTPGQFYSGPRSFKYAQSWAMIHFFYEHEKGKHRPRIETYFKKLKEGGDARAAYEAGFGDAKMDELQKEWLEYVKKLEPSKK